MNCEVCRSPRKMVDTVLSTSPSPIRSPLPSTSVLDPATRNAPPWQGLHTAEAVAQLGCLLARSRLIAAASSPRGSCTRRRFSISRRFSSALRFARMAAARSSSATSRSNRRRFSSARCRSRVCFSCFAARAALLRASMSLLRCSAAARAPSRACSARATEARNLAISPGPAAAWDLASLARRLRVWFSRWSTSAPSMAARSMRASRARRVEASFAASLSDASPAAISALVLECSRTATRPRGAPPPLPPPPVGGVGDATAPCLDDGLATRAAAEARRNSAVRAPARSNRSDSARSKASRFTTHVGGSGPASLTRSRSLTSCGTAKRAATKQRSGTQPL